LVLVIGGELLFPEDFRDHAEVSPAVEAVNAIGNRDEFKIAEGQALHAFMVAQRAYLETAGLAESQLARQR
jgi:hypothetical protein